MNLPKAVYYYGVDSPLPERTELRAGPLSLIFEDGSLRYVRLGQREILRRVYFALRDRNWDTLPVHISNLRKEIGKDAFRISYDAENRQNEINFVWQGTITGAANGTVTFSVQGSARSNFLRNRLGLCVLHPIRECAGQVCRVERVDGTVLQERFPRFVSPHQPFMDVRAISHEIAPGVWAEARFQGEIFETEDQRNWTDGSYKTYSTPLRLPYPVQIETGANIAQSLTLSLTGPIAESIQESLREAVNFTVGTGPARPLPRIGLSMASHDQPLSPKEIMRLRSLKLVHLRVDLDLSQPGYESRLMRAAREATELGASLEAAITVTNAAGDELKKLRALADRLKPAISSWLIFHASEKSTGEKWIHLARRQLSSYDLRAKIGGGTNVYFAELNRNRSPVDHGDLICYPVNPQVHAFDSATMAENLEAQAFTIESARQFAGELPIAVTPVTLRRRFNPNTMSMDTPPVADELPAAVDTRQMSLFGAAWTTGSIKYLAEAGAYSVTYYETTGWRGVIEIETGAPLPDKFRSVPGGAYPLYHVLADMGEFASGEVIPSTSDAPLKVEGLALRSGRATRIILANLSPALQRVRVIDAALGPRVYVKLLDENSVNAAMLTPESFRAEPGTLSGKTGDAFEVDLLPFAIARIDSPGTDAI